jgi:hypothetical protein
LKIGLRLTSREVFRGLTSLEGEVTAGQFVELIERMITVDRKLTRPGHHKVRHEARGSVEHP